MFIIRSIRGQLRLPPSSLYSSKTASNLILCEELIHLVGLHIEPFPLTSAIDKACVHNFCCFLSLKGKKNCGL